MSRGKHSKTEEPAKKQTRKEREREAHRREILEAAERVFIRDGYFYAKIETIAEEAEFAAGTLYNFFKSKEDLYVHVLLRIAEEFMERFEKEVLSVIDPLEAVGALIELRLTHFEAHRGFFRVLLETAPGSRLDPERALPQACRAIYRRYLTETTRLLERGMKKGVFRKGDPSFLALGLEGVATAAISYWAQDQGEASQPDRIPRMKETIFGWLQPPEPGS